MPGPPTSNQTTTRFLEGLGYPGNTPVWEEFDARYRPILMAVGRRLGLSETDAADAAQEAILRFIREFRGGKYDRSRGRLGAWMTMMAKSCIAEQWRSRARARVARGESAMAGIESEGEALDRVWDQEVRAEVLARAGQMLQSDTRLDAGTIRAFERLCSGGRSPAEVGAELGMSTDSVYKARARCLARLREIVAQLGPAYGLD